MKGALKPIEWMGDTLERVRSFPKQVRQQVGFELETLQHGMEPSDWKPLPTVGPGVNEIRIRGEGEHRVLYVAKFQRAVYILHAFVKKSQKTPRASITLAKTRYRDVLRTEDRKK